jgi:hypothetical protein
LFWRAGREIRLEVQTVNEASLVGRVAEPEARPPIGVEDASAEIGISEMRAPLGDFGDLALEVDPKEELEAASDLRVPSERQRVTLLSRRPHHSQGPT